MNFRVIVQIRFLINSSAITVSHKCIFVIVFGPALGCYCPATRLARAAAQFQCCGLSAVSLLQKYYNKKLTRVLYNNRKSGKLIFFVFDALLHFSEVLKGLHWHWGFCILFGCFHKLVGLGFTQTGRPVGQLPTDGSQ